MSEFAKYLGDLEVKIGEDSIRIRPTLKHKQQILGLQSNTKKGMSESDWAVQHKIFKEIIKAGDTEATDDEIDGFLLRHDIEFMMQLFVAFGWLSSKDIEVMKASLKDELTTTMTQKS